MSDQLAALCLPFERVEAVYGTDMPDNLKSYFLSSDGKIASEMLPGEVGCYASHLKVMQKIADSNEPGLVLEDDLTFAPDFASILDAMHGLPAGWDIIRLSNSYRRPFFPVKPLTGRYHAVKFSRVPPSSAAYLITPAGARKFLTWKGLRTLPVDQDMRRTWDCRLVTFGVYPMPAIPESAPCSSIDSMQRRPFGARRRGGGMRDSIKRVTHDIGWLGPAKWTLTLVPRSLRAPTDRPPEDGNPPTA